MSDQQKTQIPSHYRSVQIDKNLHQVPSHIVDNINRMVKPYDEFRETLAAPPEVTKLRNELAEKNKRILELETELLDSMVKIVDNPANSDAPIPEFESEGTPDDSAEPDLATATSGQPEGNAAISTDPPQGDEAGATNKPRHPTASPEGNG